MPQVSMLDIDRGSAEGKRLIDAVAGRHGAGLADVASHCSRLFFLRSEAAPGLRFVGGEARSGTSGQVFQVGGAGESVVDAVASCLGEAAERLSQVERAGDVACAAVYRDVEGRVFAPARELIRQALEQLTVPEPVIDWVEARCLQSGAPVLVPADWCLRRDRPGLLARAGTPLSTGTAAGSDLEGATERALLELVERDAAGLWWLGGRRPRPLAADGAAMAEATRLFGVLRDGALSRRTILLGITSDLSVPVVAAVSCDNSGRGLACGLGARSDLAAAARAAILELCQMEIGLALASGRREAIGEDALTPIERKHIALAERIDPEQCALLSATGLPAVELPSSADAAGRLRNLRQTFDDRNIGAALVNLTRPDIGVPVARAIAPALQLLPSEHVSARLSAAIFETGGGAQWTGGVALL